MRLCAPPAPTAAPTPGRSNGPSVTATTLARGPNRWGRWHAPARDASGRNAIGWPRHRRRPALRWARQWRQLSLAELAWCPGIPAPRPAEPEPGESAGCGGGVYTVGRDSDGGGSVGHGTSLRVCVVRSSTPRPGSPTSRSSLPVSRHQPAWEGQLALPGPRSLRVDLSAGAAATRQDRPDKQDQYQTQDRVDDRRTPRLRGANGRAGGRAAGAPSMCDHCASSQKAESQPWRRADHDLKHVLRQADRPPSAGRGFAHPDKAS